jgi:AAA domain
LIILDALYRLLPPNCDENSNANMAGVYNAIDGYIDRIGSGVFLVHHSSKGNQSGKSVTDTGAGAGAQSRACDTHFILRPHEENGCVVVDAAVRSFPPIEPFCLRWHFPIWTLAGDLDPENLRKDKPRKKAEPVDAREPWTVDRFAAAFLTTEPKTEATICAEAVSPELSERKSKLLLRAACESGRGFKWESNDRKKPIRYANREPNLMETGGVK